MAKTGVRGRQRHVHGVDRVTRRINALTGGRELMVRKSLVGGIKNAQLKTLSSFGNT